MTEQHTRAGTLRISTDRQNGEFRRQAKEPRLDMELCAINWPDHDGGTWVFSPTKDDARKRAARIVHCVNHFDTIVGTLKELEQAAIAHRDCTDGSEREWLTTAAAKARAAIALAEGGGE